MGNGRFARSLFERACACRAASAWSASASRPPRPTSQPSHPMTSAAPTPTLTGFNPRPPAPPPSPAKRSGPTTAREGPELLVRLGRWPVCGTSGSTGAGRSLTSWPAAPTNRSKAHKLLSESPAACPDAAVAGDQVPAWASRRPETIPLETGSLRRVSRLDATVATNALLESERAEPTVPADHRGIRRRAAHLLPEPPRAFSTGASCCQSQLYLQASSRSMNGLAADGAVLRPLDAEAAERPRCARPMRTGSASVRDSSSCTATATPKHERRVGEIARADRVSSRSAESHAGGRPLMRLVSRGDTSVVDAYLSPVLRRYVAEVADELAGVPLLFMQSNGGLTGARVCSAAGTHSFLRRGRRAHRRDGPHLPAAGSAG